MTNTNAVTITSEGPNEMRMHYHVLAGLAGGYLPDSNYAFESRADAIASAKEDIERYNDGAGWILPPPYEGGFKQAEGDDGYFYRLSDDPHDLGEYIEVTECHEPDCYDDNGELLND